MFRWREAVGPYPRENAEKGVQPSKNLADQRANLSSVGLDKPRRHRAPFVARIPGRQGRCHCEVYT